MKKLLYIFLIVILSSCSDWLDLDPQQSLPIDKAYKSLNDCDNAARGIYVRVQQVYASNYILTADAFCDNLISFSKGRNSYSEFRSWNLNSGNSYMWLGPYMAIVNSSLLIENIPVVAADNKEFAAFNYLKAEALALRALMHFELVRLHAKAVFFASDTELGVPYVRSTDYNNKPARQTVKQNYVDIKAELLEAYDLMTTAGANALNIDNTRLRKNSVAAILARVYLAEHDYVNAAKYAGLAIDAAVGVKIATVANFANVWLDRSNEGVYWKLAVVEKDRLLVGNFFNQFLGGEFRSEFVAPQSLVSFYTKADVRKAVYFNTSTFQNYKANHIVKYVGNVTDMTAIRNQVNLKVIRGAEMYLTRAEAMNRASIGDKGLADIKVVLNNRGLDSRIADGRTDADLLAFIMKQRRMELFCEWDRYNTIKRLGNDIIRLDGEGELSDGTGRTNIQFTLLSTDHRFLFPILQSEIDANSNIVQNPGY